MTVFPIKMPCPHPVDVVERFLRRLEIRGDGECWDWVGVRLPKGYGHMAYGLANGGGSIYTHRLALELSTGERIPPGMMALHSCDRPQCCAPHHLRVGSCSENARDAVARGQHPVGDRAGTSKLDERQALAIIESAARGERVASIARRYPVSAVQIGNIVSGKSWAHLPRPASLVALVESRRRAA